MRYKPTKIDIVSDKILELKTETGHIVKFRLEPNLSIDIDNEDEYPFFFLSLEPIYEGVESTSKSMNFKQVRRLLRNRNLLTGKEQYDHIQLGFIYSDGDPNNHKWMLNFMDQNNNFLFNYISDNVEMKCPFTTTSWEDGIWHGRFVIYKKDIDKILEPKQGTLIIKGKGNIGDQNVTKLEKNIVSLSLRFNVHTNMWYCDVFSKKGKIGEYPCKQIICDVPFKGNVDNSFAKPKVTVNINANDVKGITLALNALIIKRK